MSVKLLTEQCLELPRLKGGYTGSSEATLVEMPHCWKSRVTAHIKMTLTLAGDKSVKKPIVCACHIFLKSLLD